MRTKKHTVGRKKTHVKTHRARALTPVQIARAKWRLAVLKSREINKNWKIKLAEKTAEFKQKLDELTQKAYQKAVENVASETRRKIEAKAKAISAAEAKFEKKFIKLLSRKTKRRGKTRRHVTSQAHTPTTQAISTNQRVGKGRGRKSTKLHSTNHIVTVGHRTKQRGRKPTTKATLHVSSHRLTTGHTKRRGRPAKRRALTKVSRTHRRTTTR